MLLTKNANGEAETDCATVVQSPAEARRRLGFINGNGR
jgi:hypothetical protein